VRRAIPGLDHEAVMYIAACPYCGRGRGTACTGGRNHSQRVDAAAAAVGASDQRRGG
jgi:hypothetical protein